MMRCVGIDLGTSTSEVAVLKEGRPVLLPNDKGETVTPSLVYFGEDGQVRVGSDARSYAVLEPENTIMEVKRLMGSGQVVRCRGKRMTPGEVSAEILKYLKRCAEEALGEPVEEAVITVPAYFTNEQRVATREAGALAGLKVERIINEPTAAALAYGIDHMQDQEMVLVYDFGGGTLDVTVMEMYLGVVDVKASSGNNALGGKDFDEVVINHLAEQFLKKHKIDLRSDRKAMWRLKEAVEAAKIRLSDAEKTMIDIPLIAAKAGKPLGIHQEFTRDMFEDLIRDMVQSTFAAVDKALEDAGMKPEEIGLVLLVGGSTRIPLVRRLMAEKFGKEPRCEVDPEKAVALGAAVQTGIIRRELAGEEGLIVTDVCPYTLGISVSRNMQGIESHGWFDPLIKRNTTVPVTAKKQYCTARDNQDAVSVETYQGEAPRVIHNRLIGQFNFKNIPPAPAGRDPIDIQFSYDINGILNVEATMSSTGQTSGITIDTRDIVPMVRAEEELAWKQSSHARRLRPLIRLAEKKLAEQRLDASEREGIRDALSDLKRAMVKEDMIHVKRYEEELTERLYGLDNGDQPL